MITDSCTSLDQTGSRSDLDKEDPVEEPQHEDPTQKRPMSTPPITARPNGETLLKKRAESADVLMLGLGNKARPIPEVQVESDPIPRDPDKDSPDVYVSLILSICKDSD